MSYDVSYTMAPPCPPATFSHATALQRLRLMGWQPSTVYDIGAFHGQWWKDAAQIFPAAEFLLFEANADNEGQLISSGYRYFIAVLAAKDGEERTFFTAKNAHPSGASLYRENTTFYKEPASACRNSIPREKQPRRSERCGSGLRQS